MSVNRNLDLDGENSESLTAPLISGIHRFALNNTSQVALVGADVSPIESLDYEILENEFFKQDWRSQGTVHVFQYILMKWFSCFRIGIIVGMIGFCNNLAVDNIAGVKFVITSNMMLERRFLLAFLVFFSYNLVMTVFASTLTSLVAPAAAGSGIPEVKAYLNGVDAPGIFRFGLCS